MLQLSTNPGIRMKLLYWTASALVLVGLEGSMGNAFAQPPQKTAGATDFDKIMRVLTHKRCVNCHPSDGVPRQGEDSHPHYFGIERGKENVGFDATKCNTCHQVENNDYSGVPGAPEWSLAPDSMRWQGLTRVEIAKSILNPKRNGGRTPEQVMHHLTEHELVLWAWAPGVNADGKPREKPPVSKKDYIQAVKRWFKRGSPIPSK
ncbi:MAG: hypothetical protein AAFU85_23140 [Planctomycetota bacterium]